MMPEKALPTETESWSPTAETHGEVRKLITRGCYGISYRMEPVLSVSDGFGY